MYKDIIEENKKFWSNIEKKYPNINKIIDEQQVILDEAIETQMDVFNFLENNYPVEGYEWDFEPNDMKIELFSKKVSEESERKSTERLEKQYKCVEGIHHFKEINGIKWCSFCGLLVNNNKKYIPENPHFLSNERKEK